MALSQTPRHCEIRLQLDQAEIAYSPTGHSHLTILPQPSPVYNTVKEAVRAQGAIDMSVTFIPGPGLKTAVLEAIDSGVKYIVAPVERVPLPDIMEMVS
ncbi:unnamed protein product, partial [marine sediment metagenome]